jgi:hypothetical protein
MIADETGATLSSAAAKTEPAQAGSRPAPTSQIREADPGPPVLSLRWFWTLGQEGQTPTPSMRATIVALALLIAFLTVVELWQVPPPNTSLIRAGDAAKEKESTGLRAAPAVAEPAPGRVRNIFDSNFSRIVLSGLGGLAAITLIGDEPKGFNERYYFILFVVFFVSGLVLSALIRGFGEAVRSRIVLSRPAAIWPQRTSKDFDRASRRYWARRFWYWLTSFRATLLVFIETAFNVLTGRNQLQSALFSETITDLHEALLEAAERTREEVHRAVIRALDRKHALPRELPYQEEVRVAVSLLSADGSSVYYIAWEHGSLPHCFDDHTVAWFTAASGEARWCKTDLSSDQPGKWDPIYRKNPDEVLLLKAGSVRGAVAPLRLEDYYKKRAEDYEGFVVLPMPWINRGGTGLHRRGCLHISFKRADYMNQLWENLEHYPAPGKVVPNYDQWRGLLNPPEPGKSDLGLSLIADDVLRHTTETAPPPSPGTALAERRVQTQVLAVRSESALIETKPEEMGVKKVQAPKSVAILDAELGAVLHQALEVLGHALSHFDDEVYDVYVRSRRPSAEIPR